MPGSKIINNGAETNVQTRSLSFFIKSQALEPLVISFPYGFPYRTRNQEDDLRPE